MLTRAIGRYLALLMALLLSMTAGACGAGQTSTVPGTLRPPSTLTPLATPAVTPEVTATPSGTTRASASSAPVAGSSASPEGTPIDLSPYLTSSIDLVNIADDAVDVEVGIASQDSTEVTTVATYHLEPFDSVSEQVVAAVYRITFKHTDPGLSGTTCDLNVEDGNQFELAVAPELVTIVKVGYQPTDAAELVASTSSLCKR